MAYITEESLYICPQCGPDPAGGDAHTLSHHTVGTAPDYTQDPLPEEIVQSGNFSIDEVHEKTHLPPWGPPSSEPVVFTAEGAVPMSQLAKDAREKFAGTVRVRLLEKLVRLLLEQDARGKEIARLRQELGL